MINDSFMPVWFGFHGIMTIVGYLIANPVYISNIYDLIANPVYISNIYDLV